MYGIQFHLSIFFFIKSTFRNGPGTCNYSKLIWNFTVIAWFLFDNGIHMPIFTGISNQNVNKSEKLIVY